MPCWLFRVLAEGSPSSGNWSAWLACSNRQARVAQRVKRRMGGMIAVLHNRFRMRCGELICHRILHISMPAARRIWSMFPAKAETHRVAVAGRIRMPPATLEQNRRQQQKGRRTRYRPHRRDSGVQTHRRTDSAVSSDSADARNDSRVCHRRGGCGDRLQCDRRDGWPYRCGNGGVDRALDRVADDLRYVQGGRSRHGDRQYPPAGKLGGKSGHWRG